MRTRRGPPLRTVTTAWIVLPFSTYALLTTGVGPEPFSKLTARLESKPSPEIVTGRLLPAWIVAGTSEPITTFAPGSSSPSTETVRAAGSR